MGNNCLCSIPFPSLTAQGVPSVLKAQILAGGRGKGVFDSGLKGGVHIVKMWVAAMWIRKIRDKLI
jgi:succinyl-CoA synthetase beta subunit